MRARYAWDYEMSEEQFEALLAGRATIGRLGRAWAAARLIDSAPYSEDRLPPGARTGFRNVSQVMIDNVVSVPRSTIGEEIGECSAAEIEAVDADLRRWLQLA